MPALVPTLASALGVADGQFRAGRLSHARRAYASLLERAQDKGDHATEVIARVMLAWAALRARDLDGARDGLEQAAQRVDPQHLDSYARYRKVLVRLALEDGAPGTALTEAQDYLR